MSKDRAFRTYITFGQVHAHATEGGTVDKDTVAVIKCDDAIDGRTQAMIMFNGVFCMSYFEQEWDDSKLRYFPKGYVYVN